MATYVPAKRGVEYIFYVSLVQQADTKLLQANPTLASGDVTISKDGGAFANLTTLPTVTPASGKAVKVTVSNTEMTADNVLILFSDAAGAQWCDLSINIQTAARQIDDLCYPTTSGRSIDVDATGGVEITTNQAVNVAQWNGSAVATPDTAGYPVVTIKDGTGQGEIALTGGAVDTVTTVTTTTNLTNAATSGDLTATMKASVNAEVDTALADINLDHLVGTATGIPAVPAGTYLDQIMDDGTAVYDRTTDSLQAIRDNMSAGAGDWTAGEKEHIRHRLGIDGTATAPTATPSLATAAAVAGVQADTDDIQTKIGTPVATLATDIATVDTVVDAVKAKTDSLTFTVANKVDANTKSVNDVTIVGDGSGTPFNV